MKKLPIILSLSILACNLSASAQKDSIILGGSLGFGTNLNSKETKSSAPKVLKNVFAFSFDYKVAQNVYVGTGVYASTVGFDFKNDEGVDQASQTVSNKSKEAFKVGHLTLPIIVSYHYGENVKMRVGIGGYYGRYFERFNSSSINKFGVSTDSITKTYSDWGLVSRVGVIVPLFYLYENLYFNFDLFNEFGLTEKNFSKYKSINLNTGFSYSF